MGTTPTQVSNVDLEAWSIQRDGGVVTVVIALHNHGSDLDGAAAGPLISGLDENGNGVYNHSSKIGLLDTGTLKEYLTFADVDKSGFVSHCLCSSFSISSSPLMKDQPAYYAAVVAAPPATTKTVTLVTGIGVIANLPVGH